MKKNLVCGVVTGMLSLSVSLSACDNATVKEIEQSFSAVSNSICSALYHVWSAFLETIPMWFHDYTFERTAEKLNADWGITIPNSARLEFSDYTGLINYNYYTIFSFENEPSDFLADFSTEKNEDFISDFQQLTATILPDDSSRAIDWGNDYCWRYMAKDYDESGCLPDELFLVYVYKQQYLYVGEIWNDNSVDW